jgi:TusA-related sulfurtransferase
VSGDEIVVDSRGRLCPLPVIDLARAAAGVDAVPGTVLVLLADDPAAAGDVPAWCAMRGHEYLGATPPDADGAAAYRVRLA